MTRLISLPTHHDLRGSLCVAEWDELPFEPKRVFWIYDTNETTLRGGHAHRKCAEIVFAVKGSFVMTVDNGKTRQSYKIDSPEEGIYIAPGEWCELSSFAPETVCVVLASIPYETEGYINDYEQFKATVE